MNARNGRCRTRLATLAAVALWGTKPASGTAGNAASVAYSAPTANVRCLQLNVARVGGAAPPPGSRPNLGSPGFSPSRKNQPGDTSSGLRAPIAATIDGLENPAYRTS